MILTGVQRRALSYVAVANAGGHQPTGAELMEWMYAPGPRPGKRGELITPAVPSGLTQMFRNIPTPSPTVISAIVGKPAVYGPSGPSETFPAHLERLGWIRSDLGHRLTVTAFGHALLKEPPEVEDEYDNAVQTVILDAGGPLAYALLIRHIGSSGPAFVIDPYVKVEDLHQLITLTATSRVLVGGGLRDGEVSAIRALLSNPPRPIEVRQASRGVLHDRYVIGELGVHQYGTSMNGLGKNPTTLFEHRDQVALFLRNLTDQQWSDAASLNPA